MGFDGSSLAYKLSETLPQKPIRVLLDARKLEHGGIGVYLSNLIDALGLRSDVKVSVLLRAEDKEKWTSKLAQNVRVLTSKRRLYSVSEYLLFAGDVNWGNFDVFHSPHYTLPFFIPVPKVVTIHDLIHITNPQRFFYPIVAKRLISSALHRTNAIITVSKASMDAISTYFPDLKPLCRVIPNAIKPQLVEALSGAEDSDLEETPYFVSIFSNLKTHKGFDFLLKAFQKFRSQPSNANVKLKLLGQAFSEDWLRRNRRRLPKGVEVLGRVSDSELVSALRGAKAYLQASVVEGFCLPVLEAKASGTRVVTVPNEAVEELLDVNDSVSRSFAIDDFVEAIKLLEVKDCDPAASQQYLNRYSCHKIAEDTLDVYRHTIKTTT